MGETHKYSHDIEYDIEEGILKVLDIYHETEHIILNESQTRVSLIDTFIRALGYDISHPNEVRVEYWTDEEYKEKADYVIYRNSEALMIIEAKSVTHNLNTDDEEQLINYLNSEYRARVGVLTNGLEYRFFGRNEANEVINSPLFTIDIKDNVYGRDMDILVALSKENTNEKVVDKYFIKKNVEMIMAMELNRVLMYPSDGVLREVAKQLGLEMESLEVIKEAYYKNIFEIDMNKQAKSYETEETRRKEEKERLAMQNSMKRQAKMSYNTRQKPIRKVVNMLEEDNESLVGFKPTELRINEGVYPLNNWITLQKILLELMDDNAYLRFNVLFHNGVDTEISNLSHTDIPYTQYETVEFLPNLKIYAKINTKTTDIKKLCYFIGKYMGFDKFDIALV